MRERAIFLDISPLMEQHYSGIPVVTLSLAKSLLSIQRSYFFLDDMVIPRSVVELIVKLRKPWPLYHALSECCKLTSIYEILSLNSEFASIAIFPNTLSRKIFDFHILVVHDISYILECSTHHSDTIKHHCKAMYSDSQNADLFVCVSQSTAEDLICYFGISSDRVLALKIGVELNGDFYPPLSCATSRKPFALFIGTFEPRKNIELVFKAIAFDPSVLLKYDFILCGRDGWLFSYSDMLENYRLSEHARDGLICRYSFISEDLKSILLSNADVLIYPSLFEGFGLPVAEALQYGCTVITSYSSSLPEAGECSSNCIYIDPASPIELSDALHSVVHREVASADVYRNNVFSWDAYLKQILTCPQLEVL